MIDLYIRWVDAKQAEKEAQEARRDAEDNLIEALEIDRNKKGTENFFDERFKVSVTKRIITKVTDKGLPEFIKNNDIPENVFRWKAELNQKEWSKLDDEKKELLSDFVTTSVGRPSFIIEEKEQ